MTLIFINDTAGGSVGIEDSLISYKNVVRFHSVATKFFDYYLKRLLELLQTIYNQKGVGTDPAPKVTRLQNHSKSQYSALWTARNGTSTHWRNQ